MSIVILALDASSTTIGWCVYDGQPRDHGEILLTGRDIGERCRQAYAALGLLLLNHADVDVIALESPVARFAKAVIPQARVSGAILTAAALKQVPVKEIEPSVAKRALTGKGNADKAAMRAAALVRGVVGEHAADALGIALACVPTVRVVHQ